MPASDPSDELLQLHAELAAAREWADRIQAHALETKAELAKVRAVNADLLAHNAHLELMNEKMRRDKYGALSERRSRLLEQLEIAFGDLGADACVGEIEGEIAAAKTTSLVAFTRKRTPRRDFPADRMIWVGCRLTSPRRSRRCRHGTK